MVLDFIQIANYDFRESVFTLDDVVLGRLTIYNVLGE